MRFSIITSLFAASALAAPAPVSKVTRDGRSVIEFSFCNQCTGTLSCTQTRYRLAKTEGDGDHGDCNTPATALQDACDVANDIPTPYGTASYLPTTDCEVSNDGSFAGYLYGTEGGGFRYTCNSVYEQFSVYCGFTFACNVFLTCTEEYH